MHQSTASSTPTVASPVAAQSGRTGIYNHNLGFKREHISEAAAAKKTNADPFGLFTPPEFLDQSITLSPKLTAEHRRDARIRAAAREFRASERARKDGATGAGMASATSTTARARATGPPDHAGTWHSSSSSKARRIGPAASGLQPLEQVPMLRVPVGIDPTSGSVPVNPRPSNYPAPHSIMVNGSAKQNDNNKVGAAGVATTTAAAGSDEFSGEAYAVDVALWEQAPPAPLPPLRFLRPRRLAADLAGDR